MKNLAFFFVLVVLHLLLGEAALGSEEAPAAFDRESNGLVDNTTHQEDATKFEEVEEIADGLGPIYNGQACRECHQNPESGGVTQITELRVGHRDSKGHFVNPSVPIGDGAEVILGRTLINDRAICPNASFPNLEIQEHVPDTETIRTQRISLNLLGDGFVEAVADETLTAIATRQCRDTHGRICGKAISVPVVEAPGTFRIGRFGWKNQHASLLSFAGDAYLNEMGITNRLFPTEVTSLCDTVADPEDKTGPDGLTDIDHFTRFVRATKAPPRDTHLAENVDAKKGAALFDSIGCVRCHVRTIQTMSAGAQSNGGTFTVPAALGDKVFHPFSDFLLHDVGTGDGVALSVTEHHGARYRKMQTTYELTANRMRTAPLWGVRTHSRLMHDGKSVTFTDAILRHHGEASLERKKFLALTNQRKRELLTFLRSL